MTYQQFSGNVTGAGMMYQQKQQQQQRQHKIRTTTKQQPQYKNANIIATLIRTSEKNQKTKTVI